MAIDRRAALTLFAATGLPFPTLAADGVEAALIGAARDEAGFAAFLLDSAGATLARAALPGRGHGAAVSRRAGMAVVFARRPGMFAVAFDLRRRRTAATFGPPADRRFNGHGCFSGDGRLLFAAENDFEAAQGALGVYDVGAGFRRIGEFGSGGVGPHEILTLTDGVTIAVANGGIETHPDLPRMKLNLAEMAPNLAYVDSRSGALVERVEAPAAYRQVSIRHMAAAADGAVWWGGQYEGPSGDLPPLIGVHRRGGKIAYLEASALPGLRNYVGSVAVSVASDRVAATSPRGGLMTVWDARTRRLIETRRRADVAGVAPRGDGFVTSDGFGRLIGSDGALGLRSDFSWDNHLTALDPAGVS